MQGVYKIENVNNGKKYIGSSKDIEKRFYQHRRELENKTHHSVKLQRAWSISKNKDIFLFEVVEIVDNVDILRIGTYSNKYYLWIHYRDIDFAVYRYDKGNVVLVKDVTDETTARLKRMNLYDGAHHQVRGVLN